MVWIMRLETLRNGQFFVYIVSIEAKYCSESSKLNIFYPQNNMKEAQYDESNWIF
jgi:hypothetical protein